VGRFIAVWWPTHGTHWLGRGTGQLCGVCFRGGGVDSGAWGAVAARGAPWRVGLIGAADRRPVGRPRGTKRPTSSVYVLGRGTGQLCGVCFRGGGVDGGAWGAAAARGAAWRVGLICADFGCGRRASRPCRDFDIS